MSSISKRDRAVELQKIENKFGVMLEMDMEVLFAAMMIAANDMLHVGPGRANDFIDTVMKTDMDIVDMMSEDAKDDRELVWTHAKIEETLKRIFGDNWEKNKQVFRMILPQEDN